MNTPAEDITVSEANIEQLELIAERFIHTYKHFAKLLAMLCKSPPDDTIDLYNEISSLDFSTVPASDEFAAQMFLRTSLTTVEDMLMKTIEDAEKLEEDLETVIAKAKEFSESKKLFNDIMVEKQEVEKPATATAQPTKPFSKEARLALCNSRIAISEKKIIKLRQDQFKEIFKKHESMTPGAINKHTFHVESQALLNTIAEDMEASKRARVIDTLTNAVNYFLLDLDKMHTALHKASPPVIAKMLTKEWDTEKEFFKRFDTLVSAEEAVVFRFKQEIFKIEDDASKGDGNPTSSTSSTSSVPAVPRNMTARSVPASNQTGKHFRRFMQCSFLSDGVIKITINYVAILVYGIDGS